MKTLLLVSAGLGRPHPDEWERLEQADQYPRVSLFNRTLHADMLDERSMSEVPIFRRRIYKLLPIAAGQVIEAFLLKRNYDAVLAWAENLGIPLAFLMRLSRSKTPQVALFSWISGSKKKFALRMVRSHIDRIILMSSVQWNYAVNDIGLSPSRVTLLKWPVDTKFWRPMDVKSEGICSVGREMRDYGSLVKSLRDLHIPCHIAANVIPGKKDSWVRALEQEGALPEGVTIGKKSYVELRELYARSKFLVLPLLPTDTDNGTTSILEAMAMGKPVICSATQGQVDVLREGKTGFFVPVGDVRALRERIQYLWKNPDVAVRMGKEARKTVEENHTLERFVDQVKTIVAEVISHRSAEYAKGRQVSLS